MLKKLELWHPQTGQQMSWEVDLPEDFESLRVLLKQDAQQHEHEL